MDGKTLHDNPIECKRIGLKSKSNILRVTLVFVVKTLLIFCRCVFTLLLIS